MVGGFVEVHGPAGDALQKLKTYVKKIRFIYYER